MILRLPFPILKGKFTYERAIEVSFKLATLEIATKEILKCDLWEVSNFPPEQVNTAILYGAYITACKDNYQKPRYNEADATFWASHMNKESEKQFYQGVSEIMGMLRKADEKISEVKKN